MSSCGSGCAGCGGEHFNPILSGDDGALKRALYKSMGHTDEQLRRPVIAVVNSYTNATAGHANLNELTAHVLKGIDEAGGVGMVFGTIALAMALPKDTLVCAIFWRHAKSSPARSK